MPLRLLLSIFTFFIINICLPYFIYYQGYGHSLETPEVLSIIIIQYSGFNLCYLIFSGKMKIIDITFWTFSYIWLGIASFSQNLFDIYPWKDAYDNSLINYTSVIILVSFVLYNVSSIFFFPKKKDKQLKTKFSISKDRANILFFVSITLSLSVIIFLGIDSFFMPRNKFSEMFDVKSSLLVLKNISTGPVLVSLLVYISLYRFDNSTDNKKLFLFRIILLSIINIVVSNPISNARFWVGTVLLSVAFTSIPWNRNVSSFTIINIFIISFIVLFPYSDVFRKELDTELEFKASNSQIIDQLVYKGDYDAYQMILNSVEHIAEKDLTYGRQLLGAVFFWFPRAIWDSKPYGSGQFIAVERNYKFTNLSCPLWAEMLINFGILGVFVTFLLYGYLKNIIQARVLNEKSENPFLFILFTFFSAYQIYLLRGDLMNAVAYSFVFITFIFAHIKPKK